MKTACCILSYNITKGMKSYGPIGTLKKNKASKELISYQIEYLRKIFGPVDIFLVLGFGQDKIIKSLDKKKHVHIINNSQYENTNDSYAIKLFLNYIKPTINNYYGIFFLDSNTLIKNISTKKKNISWVLTKKHNKRNRIKTDYLGINTIDSELISSIFYNMGDYFWNKSFYLTKMDAQNIIYDIDNCYDNMFDFEIINFLIEKFGYKFYINEIHTTDSIEIKGLKDKYKIS